MLYDMHCHIAFAANAIRLAAEGATLGMHALSCTVRPEEFFEVRKAAPTIEDTAQAFGAYPQRPRQETPIELGGSIEPGSIKPGNIVWALGAHPWWIADGTLTESSLALFEQLAPHTPFIGEIGLDFHGKQASSASQQVAAFRRILAACDTSPRKLISLHASGAEKTLLDELERAKATLKHNCILHWYAGPFDQLQRAVSMGCFFSVGPRMLATKRGREYARAIPLDKLLLETDMPAREGTPYSAATWHADLSRAATELARIRNEQVDEMLEAITKTSASLLATS